MRAAVRVVLSLLISSGIAAAVPAQGSVTESESRALPRLLSEDDTLIGLFPGSTTHFGSHLTLERTRRLDFRTYDHGYTWIELTQGVIQTGSRWKFAYLASGPWQGLVLGAPNGLGVSLQYRQDLDKRDTGDYNDRLEPWEEPRIELGTTVNDLRQLKFQVGWRHDAASGRSIELSVGASRLDARRTWRGLDSETGSVNFGWESDRGYALHAAARTLHPDAGLQIAVSVDHEDPDPAFNWVPELNGDNGRTVAEAQVGWRLDHPEFDDVMFGVTSIWQDQDTHYAEEYCCGVPEEKASIRRRFHALGFISLQRPVVGRLIAMGGVRSGVEYFYEESANWRQSDSSVMVRGSTREYWTMVNPQIRLGARWTWKRYVFDLFVDDRLNLSYPLLGWALRVDL